MKVDPSSKTFRISKLKTRSDFDWLLALQAVKCGWSRDRLYSLYANYASDLNVAWHLDPEKEPSGQYLDGKYDCALRKIQSTPEPKRQVLAKFMLLALENRGFIGLSNGQLAVILAILYARQRVKGDEITLSMREISLISCVDLSTVSRAIKALEGRWFSITEQADLLRGNTYKINEAYIEELYQKKYGLSEPVKQFRVANCLMSLDDSIFMRAGLGITGYLILLKLALNPNGFSHEQLRKNLNIDSRRYNVLLAKLLDINAVRIEPEGIVKPNNFDYANAAKILGVKDAKSHLNKKYIYQHKLHRLNILGYHLKELDLSVFYKPGKTEYQRTLQERFGKVWLQKKIPPLQVIVPYIHRMRVIQNLEHFNWLKSSTAIPLRRIIQYLLRTGSYIRFDAHDNPDNLFNYNLDVLTGHRIEGAIRFVIPEEIELDEQMVG